MRGPWPIVLFLLVPVAGFAQEEGDEVPESVKRQIREQFGQEPARPKKEPGEETPTGEESAPKKKRAKVEKKKSRKKLLSEPDEQTQPKKKTTLPEPDEDAARPASSRTKTLPGPDDRSPTPAESPRRTSDSDDASTETPAREEKTRSSDVQGADDRSGVAAGGDRDDVRKADNETTVTQETKTEPSTPKTLTLGLGGAYVGVLGFRGIPIYGSPGTDFVAYGQSGALRVALDIPFINETEARIGVHAALPGFVAAQFLVGLTQNLTTVGPLIFFGRGAGGIELFFGAGGNPTASFISFGITGEGELGVQVDLGNRAALGIAGEVAGHYTVPLGIGFTLGLTLRLALKI